MGTYRIEVEAVGGHGCSREVPDGQRVIGCRKISCPDCTARELVKALANEGSSISSATLIHWPGEPSEVRDNLLTGIRSGNF